MAMLAGAYLSEHAGRQASTHVCRPNVQMIRFMADLPFSLTKAQSKAYREIAADMASGRVMNRLVEGDVGSGKTIVAVLAMLNAALNGYQSAFMAPTAVLAKQHYETITGLLKSWDGGEDSALINLGGFGMPAAGKGENTGDPGAHQPALQKRPLRVVLVTGSMSAAERKAAHALIRDHEADIIIGTHTLFQEKLEYADLGLIVTDEQHRFGVGQREALYRKGRLREPPPPAIPSPWSWKATRGS